MMRTFPLIRCPHRYVTLWTNKSIAIGLSCSCQQFRAIVLSMIGNIRTVRNEMCHVCVLLSEDVCHSSCPNYRNGVIECVFLVEH